MFELFIIPLLVAIFGLVCEYWIIQPIKEGKLKIFHRFVNTWVWKIRLFVLISLLGLSTALFTQYRGYQQSKGQGVLVVHTNPTGGTISIDGEIIDFDRTYYPLSAGYHHLQVSPPNNYKLLKTEFKITENFVTQVEVHFADQNSPSTSYASDTQNVIDTMPVRYPNSRDILHGGEGYKFYFDLYIEHMLVCTTFGVIDKGFRPYGIEIPSKGRRAVDGVCPKTIGKEFGSDRTLTLSGYTISPDGAFRKVSRQITTSSQATGLHISILDDGSVVMYNGYG